MKRIVSLWIVFVLLFSVISVTAFAKEADSQRDIMENPKFLDRFLEFYKDRYPLSSLKIYQEDCYHYTDPSDESTLNWALLRVSAGEEEWIEYYAEIAGRLVTSSVWSFPSPSGYVIYDAKQNKFENLTPENVDKYDGLYELFSQIELKAPAQEFEYYRFRAELVKLDGEYQNPTYRVLDYCKEDRTDKDSNLPLWVLTAAYAQPSAALNRAPVSVKIGSRYLTAKESAWPYGSQLAVLIPVRTDRFDEGYYALDQIDINKLPGLKEAILAQDLDALGFEWKDNSLFKDRFFAEFVPQETPEDELPYYDEVYCHKDSDGAADWVLIYTYNAEQPEWLFKTGCIIGDRAIANVSECSAFESRYGVYDIKNDRFVSLIDAQAENFPDLTEVVNDLELGVEVGDADQDGVISVLDATRIQKILAGIADDDQIYMDEFFAKKTFDESALRYVSDIDRDNKRSILDATRIQKYLAGIVGKHGEAEDEPLSTGVIPNRRDTEEVINKIAIRETVGKHYYSADRAQTTEQPLIPASSKQVTLITSYQQFIALNGRTATNFEGDFFEKYAMIDFVISDDNLRHIHSNSLQFDIGRSGSVLQVRANYSYSDLTRYETSPWNSYYLVHLRLIVLKDTVKGVTSIEAWDKSSLG